MSEFVIREATFRAELVGVTALLMNNPASMQRAGDDAKVKGKKAIPSPEEEATAKAYRMPSGELFVPTVALFQSMIEAGKLLNDPDNPRRRISYKIAAALFPPATKGFVLHGENGPLSEYEIDVRRAVVQNQGIQRARPRIDVPWSLTLEMGFDADLVNENVLFTVLATAGKQVGVLDYRPQKKGPYGRFQVESFEVAE